MAETRSVIYSLRSGRAQPARMVFGCMLVVALLGLPAAASALLEPEPEPSNTACPAENPEGSPIAYADSSLIQRRVLPKRGTRFTFADFLAQRQYQVEAARDAMEVAGYQLCDSSLVSRRRVNGNMCACRRRGPVSAPRDDAWVCGAKDLVVPAPERPCDYASQVNRRRRYASMCSCRRRNSATVPSEGGWLCGENEIVYLPENASTTTTLESTTSKAPVSTTSTTTVPVVTATTTTTTKFCPDEQEISRRRRAGDMCSCRRRQTFVSEGETWKCGADDVIVPVIVTSVTTTTTTQGVPTTPSACTYEAEVSRRRRGGDMCSCRRRTGKDGRWTCQGDVVVEAPPVNPYRNIYNGSNPMKIVPATKRSDNYFLIIGDWGKSRGPGQCQLAVAAKMKQYVRKQKSNGKTLLAILAVGDNFYWCGVTPDDWNNMWLNVYGTNDPGSPLFGVPWMATMGNHDYGDDDPYAFCPDVNPLVTFDGQPYACHQFNADRNPTRPSNTQAYYMPDYNFHYDIPEISTEFIFVDMNKDYVSNKIHSIGFHGAREKCGGSGVVNEFLERVKESGEELLRQRARLGTATTTVILQHYPSAAWNLKKIFEESSDGVRKVATLSAWGHAHDQNCQGRDADGNCNMVLTGGGGGCCLGRFGGFTAVHLDDAGGFVTKIESDEVRIPKSQCRV